MSQTPLAFTLDERLDSQAPFQSLSVQPKTFTGSIPSESILELIYGGGIGADSTLGIKFKVDLSYLDLPDSDQIFSVADEKWFTLFGSTTPPTYDSGILSGAVVALNKDFSTELPYTILDINQVQGVGPVGVFIVEGDPSQSGNNYAIEYSDSEYFPTLLGHELDESGTIIDNSAAGGSIVNTLGYSLENVDQLDFVSIKVPAGVSFDILELVDFQASQPDADDAFAYFAITEGPTFNEEVRDILHSAGSDPSRIDHEALANIDSLVFHGPLRESDIGMSLLPDVVEGAPPVTLGDASSTEDSFYTLMIAQPGDQSDQKLAYNIGYGSGLSVPNLDDYIPGLIIEALEDIPFSGIQLPSVNDDGIALDWSISKSPTGTSEISLDGLEVDANNQLSIVNGALENLSGSFEYVLTASGEVDGVNRTAPQKVILNIEESNDAPEVHFREPLSGVEDESLVIDIFDIQNVVDVLDEVTYFFEDQPNGHRLTTFEPLDEIQIQNISYQVVNVSTGFSLEGDELVDADSELLLTPNPGLHLSGVHHAFDLVAIDPEGAESDSFSVHVDLEERNDEPVADSASFTVVADSLLSFDLPVSDVEDDRQSLTISEEEGFESGFSISSDGRILFNDFEDDWLSLGDNESAQLSFVYSVKDTSNAISYGDVDVTIQGVNDRPSISPVDEIPGAVEDTPFEFSYSDLKSATAAADPDANDQLSFKISSQQPGSSVEFSSNSNDWFAVDTSPQSTFRLVDGDYLRWIPAQDDNSDAHGGAAITAFQIQADDGLALSNPEAVSLFVDAVNDTPQILFAPADSQNEQFGEESGIYQGLVEIKVDGSNPGNENDVVTISLEGPDADLFELTNQTGHSAELSLKEPADYESLDYFDIELRATDTSDASGESRTSMKPFKLNVVDHQDQHLIVEAADNSTVFIPNQTEALDVELFYEWDADYSGDVADDFVYRLEFDGSRLTWDQANSSADLNSNLSVTSVEGNPNQLQISSVSASSLDLTSHQTLRFKVEPDAVIGAFDFDLTPISGDSRFEQLDSGTTIAPDADAFIDDDGFMDLGVFNSSGNSLTINTNESVATHEGIDSNGTVRIIDRDNYPLPFTKSINGVVATDQDDTLILDGRGLSGVGSDLNFFFGMAAGNDVVDLTNLTELSLDQKAHGDLGYGYDTVKLPEYDPSNPVVDPEYPTINIVDFELGIDSFEFIQGDELLQLQRREDVLAELHPGGQLDDYSGVGLQFASVALDLEPGTRTVFDGVSPVLDASVFLEPGEFGDRLNVSFADDDADESDLRFEIIGDPSNGVWEWELETDGSATLKRADGHLGVHDDVSAFHQLKSHLVVAGATPIGADSSEGADINIEWISGKGETTSFSRHLHFEQLPQADNGRIDLSDRGPIKLEFVAPTVGGEPGSLIASEGSDSITMLSDGFAPNKVFGAGDDDILTSSDGGILYGGSDSDTLIALRGMGTTRLVGDDGDDKLFAGHKDVIVAGGGDDLLVARGSGNKLIGGAGVDTFVLVDAFLGLRGDTDAFNRVLDFDHLEDRLVVNVPGVTDQNNLIIDTFGSGVKIQLADPFAGRQDLAILQNTTKDQLNSSNLIFDDSLDVAAETLSRVSALDQTVASIQHR